MFYYSINCQSGAFHNKNKGDSAALCIARFLTNLGDLRILQKICYLRMTDIESIITIFGKYYNLLNNNKLLLDEVFRDIQNYQGRSKCYQPKPSASPDNTCRKHYSALSCRTSSDFIQLSLRPRSLRIRQ